MVTIINTGMAAKLSPRGGGMLTYQIGRNDANVLLRIHKNDSTGRYSREWLGIPAIRSALTRIPKSQTSFKGAVAMTPAFTGRSACNGGFLAAILRAEGVFVAEDDPKKKGMLKLASPDALDTWEKQVLAFPVPKDAEQVLLNPPKAIPNFAKRGPKPTEGHTAAQTEPEDEVDSPPDEEEV